MELVCRCLYLYKTTWVISTHHLHVELNLSQADRKQSTLHYGAENVYFWFYITLKFIIAAANSPSYKLQKCAAVGISCWVLWGSSSDC